MSVKHDWILAIVTFVATVAVTVVANGVMYAYGQGQLEHRVEALEKQQKDLRDDWRLARERIERALRENRSPTK
jgi:hypothetical protein